MYDSKGATLLSIGLWVNRSLNSSSEAALVRTLLTGLVNCGAISSLQMQSVMLTYEVRPKRHILCRDTSVPQTQP